MKQPLITAVLAATALFPLTASSNPLPQQMQQTQQMPPKIVEKPRTRPQRKQSQRTFPGMGFRQNGITFVLKPIRQVETKGKDKGKEKDVGFDVHIIHPSVLERIPPTTQTLTVEPNSYGVVVLKETQPHPGDGVSRVHYGSSNSLDVRDQTTLLSKVAIGNQFNVQRKVPRGNMPGVDTLWERFTGPNGAAHIMATVRSIKQSTAIVPVKNAAIGQ